jgi:hypothetical protein
MLAFDEPPLFNGYPMEASKACARTARQVGEGLEMRGCREWKKLAGTVSRMESWIVFFT